jgi:multiple sugar transport system permease protein
VFAEPFKLIFQPNLDAYVNAIRYDLPAALWSSLRITLGAVAIILVLAIPAAYGIARARGRIRDVALAGLILLQLLPATTLVIPMYQVLASLRLLGSIAGVVVATAAYLLPFAIILLRPFFLAVPREIEEAASVDGANRIRSFWQVTLPVARNGVLVVGVLIGMIAWGEFIYPLSFLTNPSDYPLSTLLASQVGAYGVNWPRLMALAIIIISPVIVVFLTMERRLASGLSMGAVK